KRIHNHKVFKGIATNVRLSMGWFPRIVGAGYGFKLYLIINDRGEVLNFVITLANVDDRESLKDGNFWPQADKRETLR
ncbi:MAG: hypothetical protein GY786_24585, partial [Proteobacteria bacterium]|nr:hypothetical protein [Pseudomonadota bacterium]